ncbi:MAG TPA: hypothetical protein VIF09_09245, partial [Polyangiaceae bacterium]
RRLEGGEHDRHRGPDGDRSRESPLRHRFLALGAIGLATQCKGNPTVTFEVVLPSDIADTAQWMEIGVLDGACPSPAQLGAGIPEGATVARVAFQKGDTSPPAIGALKKGAYGFAAVARGIDCGVLATGCTRADVTEARDVSIALADTAVATGACLAGESCAGGRCVPSSNPDDPSLGAGCSMQLVAAGPLGLPLELSGSDTASAPAAVVTESGFLLAYREYDAVQGAARITVAAIDEGGSLTIPPPTMLPSQCAGQDESDALGAAYLGGSGVVVSARPACPGATAGFDVFSLGPTGTLDTTSFDPLTTGSAVLSNAHAVTLSGAGSGWIAYLDQGSASVVALSGLLTPGASTRFGGAPPQTLAEASATGQTLALLAGTGTNLEVQLGLPASDGGAALTTPGIFGALAAQGSRAFVVSGGTTGGPPLSFVAYDVGATSPSTSGSLAPPGQGDPTGADVAVAGDRVFFAAEQAGALSVIVYGRASTTPLLLDTVLLSADARIPSQANVRDGRIAVAASDSRVLVAWLTATSLGPDDPVGGYALFACSP